MPRGGRRIGAGRKPKAVTAKVLQHPAAGGSVQSVEYFDPPADLNPDERGMWDQQAPHAFANRTLTRASAVAFARYCKLVVLERNEAKSSAVSGANHRGLLKQINALELQFLLTPSGKAMPIPAVTAMADPDDAFFDSAS
jgi:hypothetical protein